MRRLVSRLLAGLLLATCALAAPAAGNPLTVFAAASLTDVMQEIGTAYARQGGSPVRFSFAGSAILARQIEAGAPADVFVSADQQWMDYLAQRDLIQAGSRANVAANVLVLIAPADSPVRLSVEPGFAVKSALGARGRLATGDTDTVPAGRYAREALQTLGVWDDIAARVVGADSVRAALNFVIRGEAALGVVYATDIRGVDAVREVGRFPAGSHAPITYPVALTARAGQEAARFARFLRGPEARAIFVQQGFKTP